MIHAVKGFGIINKAEVNVSLKLSCFFDDTMDVGNLVSLKQGGKSVCVRASKETCLKESQTIFLSPCQIVCSSASTF